MPSSRSSGPVPARIVSGGQTGVDRAALDAARAAGIPVGGWCPRGRRAEDGPIDPAYGLRETPSADYAQRTAWNVRDSDATLILSSGDPAGGTAFTIEEALRRGRPWRREDPGRADAEAVRAWLRAERVRVLNVAGPRTSEVPEIYAAAYRFLAELLGPSSGS